MYPIFTESNAPSNISNYIIHCCIDQLEDVTFFTDNIEKGCFMVSSEYSHFQHNRLICRKQMSSCISQVLSIQQSQFCKKLIFVTTDIRKTTTFCSREIEFMQSLFIHVIECLI